MEVTKMSKQFKSVTEALEDANKRMKTEGIQMQTGISPKEAGMLECLRHDRAHIRSMWDTSQFVYVAWHEIDRALNEMYREADAGTLQRSDLVEFCAVFGEWYYGPNGDSDDAKLTVKDAFPFLDRFF